MNNENELNSDVLVASNILNYYYMFEINITKIGIVTWKMAGNFG